MTEDLERQILELVASDRLYNPTSSVSGKLERKRRKIATSLDLKTLNFIGERIYARIEEEDQEKARSTQEGINEFCEKFPEQGEMLRGIIEEKRKLRERHLYFGLNPHCRLTKTDYLAIMKSIGIKEEKAAELYPLLLEIGNNLAKKRKETERSILIGSEPYQQLTH